MKEFISILISFIFMSIADSIDSAFNNMISINAIVVTGSFLLIDSIFKSFGEIGIYTYRTTRKNEWQYLWFNIIFGILMGIIVFSCKNLIVNIFELSNIQKDMLSILLNFYIAYVVLGRLANGIFEIIRLKGQLKLYRLERRLKRIYRPHVTLCTNNDLSIAYKLANKEFFSFNGTIKDIWCYNQDMELIKEYILNGA